MRKFSAALFSAAAITSFLVATATPASADCLTYTGTQNPIITVGGPVPTTVYAPGRVDVDPIDCVTLVTDLVTT